MSGFGWQREGKYLLVMKMEMSMEVKGVTSFPRVDELCGRQLQRCEVEGGPVLIGHGKRKQARNVTSSSHPVSLDLAPRNRSRDRDLDLGLCAFHPDHHSYQHH